MRPVQLDPIEAGALGAPRATDEVLDQLLDLRRRQPPRARLRIVRRADGLGRAALWAAVAAVVQLQRRRPALGLDHGGEARVTLDVVVGEDAELALAGLALG